ncbi:hypothetical protein A3843_13810 [Pseudovibrio exalbescens]|uniref:Uncharacterized protein n=2 Tax=Pseudovibrio exalbescens TaxID=197461 RepID=A0A1U7JF32_9HYPH|nr:hypothetical protein A3843_13810 [Pseudovibrio exalbescens]
MNNRQDVNTEHLSNIDPVFVDLFVVFSRFEHALIFADYVHQTRRGAEVNWDAFYRHIDQLDLVEMREKCPTIVEYPPKVLQKEEDKLVWKMKFEEISSQKDIFKAAKAVRNNLFHGGKTTYSNHDEWERQKTLVTEAKNLILYIVSKMPEVKKIFEEPLP